ncbi:MAG: DUF2589 domain-containing protein [Treponema sp.]|jgi:hypothetical protein|nr:DUF2589 domain-containing protein [Treponema sp.]
MADTADQTFSDIIRGMQYAVNTAQETLQNYQFHQMQRYFREDGTPYTVFVILSDGRRVEIPQITLVPQSLLAIEELEMSFRVQVAHTDVKGGFSGEKKTPETAKTLAEPDRSSFQVQFARRAVSGGEDGGGPDAGTISVSIKFKSIPIPEGAARVLDSLNLDITEKAAGD